MRHVLCLNILPSPQQHLYAVLPYSQVLAGHRMDILRQLRFHNIEQHLIVLDRLPVIFIVPLLWIRQPILPNEEIFCHQVFQLGLLDTLIVLQFCYLFDEFPDFLCVTHSL